MNEFLPRTGPVVPVVSATERSTPAVRAVSASKTARNDVQSEVSVSLRDRARSTAAADYAKIHADIADVLANLQPPIANSSSAAEDANSAIVALMPNPGVVLPMPPTDTQIVAFVAQVAESVARQAAQARAAQAVATPIMIEAAAH